MAIYTVRVFQEHNGEEVSHRCGMPGEVWSTPGEAFDWALVAFRNVALLNNQVNDSNFYKLAVLRDDSEEVFSLVNHVAQGF